MVTVAPSAVHLSTRRQAVPVIYVTGSHYDVGYDTGRIFSGVIKDYLETYDNLRTFEQQYSTAAGREAYDKTLANMRKRYPHYVKEIQGIADGAGVSFNKLFLLHMDDIIETVNENHITRDVGGCTSIGVNADTTTFLGHTEDAPRATENHFYIVSAHIKPSPEDEMAGATEERFTSVCYAGLMPGYTSGFTADGLVFSINTLSPRDLKPGNTPRTFIARALLAARNMTHAKKILYDEGLGIGNGFSVNMIWSEGGRRDLYNVELAPNLSGDRSLVDVLKYDKDPLMHYNKYQRLQVVEVKGPIIESSESRAVALSGRRVSCRSELENALSSSGAEHEYRVFEDRDQSYIVTIVAGIFDLDKRLWSLYTDKPNNSEPVAILPITFRENI